MHTLAICGRMVNKAHDNWEAVMHKLERGIAKKMKPKHLAAEYDHSVFGALQASFDDLAETDWEVEHGMDWSGQQLQEFRPRCVSRGHKGAEDDAVHDAAWGTQQPMRG